MTHATRDISDVHRGQDLIVPFRVVDSAGDPLTLSGAGEIALYLTADPQLSPRTNQAARALEATLGDGLSISTNDEAVVEWSLDSTDWDDLPQRRYRYALWVSYGGEAAQVASGLFIADAAAD